MDPITTAIVTAVGTGLAKDVIKDSYEALKAALKKKSGSESDLVDAVDKLEKTRYKKKLESLRLMMTLRFSS
jgi:hypothetical protein